MAALRLWWDTIRGIVTTAPREHFDLLRGDVRYALAEPPAQPGVHRRRRARARRRHRRQHRRLQHRQRRADATRCPTKIREQLVAIFEKVPGAPVDKFDFSAPDFEIVRDAARSYHRDDRPIATRPSSCRASPSPSGSSARACRPEFFDVLGVSPMLGRALTADDDRTQREVVVLTPRSLDARVRTRPVVVGRTITLDRQPYTVVGVMGGAVRVSAARLREQRRAGGALPADRVLAVRAPGDSAACTTTASLARLKPGVSLAQARGELASLATTILAERYPPMPAAMAQQLSLPMWPLRRRDRRPQPPDDAGADGRRRHRAADRLRGRREPDADAGRLASARAGGPRRRSAPAPRASSVNCSPKVRPVRRSAVSAGLLLAYWTMQALLRRWRGQRCRAPNRSGSTARVVAFARARAG